MRVKRAGLIAGLQRASAALLLGILAAACAAHVESDEPGATTKRVEETLVGPGFPFLDWIDCEHESCGITVFACTGGEGAALLPTSMRVVVHTEQGPLGRSVPDCEPVEYSLPRGTHLLEVDRPPYLPPVPTVVAIDVEAEPPPSTESVCGDLAELHHPGDVHRRFLGEYSDSPNSGATVSSAVHAGDSDRYELSLRDQLDGGDPVVDLVLVNQATEETVSLRLGSSTEAQDNEMDASGLLLHGWVEHNTASGSAFFTVEQPDGTTCVPYELRIAVH